MDIIDRPFFSLLKKVYHPKGNVLHALKKSDPSYSDFGEAYFTSINHGETKGWKLHKKMLMNLIVPVGNVRFHIYDEKRLTLYKFDIGENNYGRLTVPPGLWVAFTGITQELNLILNMASIEHDSSEAINLPLESFKLN
jgi:dTDP-4-dehydrorhamnose 3,5-epimerase